MVEGKAEIWKTWPENTEKEVRSFGRFRSIHGHYYKPWVGNSGYLQVTFRMNGKWLHRKVHRLVAQTFLPNPNNWPEVNHKDCNRTNNNVDNLEWCTRKYNREYKEKFGKTQNRPVFAINLSTLEVSWFQSRGEAGRDLEVNPGCVSNVAKGKSRATKDYWFVDADDNAVSIAKNRLYDILGNKIKDLTAGDTDNGDEVTDFVTQCSLL